MTQSNRLNDLIERCPLLAPLHDDLQNAYRELHTCLSRGGKLLLCGNGGSASDCEHWAGELLKGFCSLRPLSARARMHLPEPLADKLQGSIPAIPLTGFPAFSSAFSNDVDAEFTFAQLVWGLGNPKDILIGISTSGNARNIVHAFTAARAKGVTTLLLTGRTGGKLKPLADLSLCVPCDETYRIQEMHLPIYHCLSLMLEDALFRE